MRLQLRFPRLTLGSHFPYRFGARYLLCEASTFYVKTGARFWGAAARVSCVVYTILATCVSTPHYKFRFYGRWVAFAILRLSLVALTQSLYWLIRGEKQTGPKNSLTERTEPTKRNHPGNAPVSATPTFFHPPPVVRSYNDSAR